MGPVPKRMDPGQISPFRKNLHLKCETLKVDVEWAESFFAVFMQFICLFVFIYTNQ